VAAGAETGAATCGWGAAASRFVRAQFGQLGASSGTTDRQMGHEISNAWLLIAYLLMLIDTFRSIV
jgi:hypothetical protein